MGIFAKAEQLGSLQLAGRTWQDCASFPAEVFPAHHQENWKVKGGVKRGCSDASEWGEGQNKIDRIALTGTER